jgi:hypothetical protein
MSGRVAIRLAFILASLNLLLLLAGILWVIHQVATGTTPDQYWRETVPDALVFSATGVVVATRRPAHPIGWLFIGGGLISAVQLLFGEYAASTLVLGPERLPYGATAEWLSYLLQSIFTFTMFFLILLFPTGRLLSSRWRIIAWAGVCAASVGIASSLLVPGRLEPSSPFDNPFGVDAAILGPVGAIASWLLIAVVLGALLSLLVRFIRSRGEERQQIKWFMALAVVGISSLVSVSVVSALLPSGNSSGALVVNFLQNLLWIIVPASLPIAVGIAILRYRLYDIDHIINRTLVYAALTALLAAGYFGTIMALQGIGSLVFQVPFRAITGQETQLATVAATLAMAALFSPLRRRIQGFIDRRFYRSKYDAAKTLESFSTKLRNETDVEALNNDLISVVSETMQPAHVSLWLRPDRDAKQK